MKHGSYKSDSKRRLNLARLVFGLALTAGLCPSIYAAQDDADASITAVDDLVYKTYVAIHEHPELGNEEFRTKELLLGELEKLGYKEFHESMLAPTAVIAVLDSGRPGPTIALRAEMDARKTEEIKSNSPRSTIDGVMHNCGHDAHAAMLLGSAAYLKQHTDTIAGRVVFLFQPAEETRGGADDLVLEGILTDLGVEAIFAQHSFSGMPVGTVSIAPGPTLAGSNYFTLNVIGKGSHAALPSGGSDTLVSAAKILADLAELPARRLPIVARPVVISPTRINSNSKSSNVVPTSVEVKGTIRAFEDVSSKQGDEQSIDELIRQYLDGAAAAYGVEYELEIHKGSPPTINDKKLYEITVAELQKDGRWPGVLKTDVNKGMFSEDFSYYTEVIPALFFGLGIQRGELGEAGVHTPDFNIHPDAFSYGVRLLVSLAQLHTAGEITPY